MKKIVLFAAILFACAGVAAAQSVEVGVSVRDSKKTEKEIPLQMRLMAKMPRQFATRFMLYPTGFDSCYYELDTTNGKLWSITLSAMKNKGNKTLINPEGLIGEDEETCIGRFEMSVTAYDSYNLLLDNLTGRIWLVVSPTLFSGLSKPRIIPFEQTD